MAHFAKLDENNKVLEVHFILNDDLGNADYPDSEALGITKLTNDTGYTNWKQTSVNSTFRGHFAQEGYTYDTATDTFITIKPFDSWVYNSSEKVWKPPVSYPTDGNLYIWNETSYQADNTRGWVVYE